MNNFKGMTYFSKLQFISSEMNTIKLYRNLFLINFKMRDFSKPFTKILFNAKNNGIKLK